MCEEKWNNIDNTDGYYQISNHGRIRSFKNGRWGKKNKPKILKLGYDNSGYVRQSINHNGNRWNISVHREVAKAFILNPENKIQVNHIDGDKKNNNVSNLEWVTQSENMLHANNIGLFNHKKGVDRHNSVFNKQQARLIRFQYKVQKLTHKKLSVIYNCSQKTISNVINSVYY